MLKVADRCRADLLTSDTLPTNPFPDTGGRSISVCHVIPYDSWAGAEVQVAILLGELSRVEGLSVAAIILGEGKLAEVVRNEVATKVIAQSSGGFLGCYRQAAGFLRTTKVDILHSHKSKADILATFLAKRLGIPHIVRTHHGLPEPRTMKDRIAYQLEWMTERYASRVICVSDDLRCHVRKRTSFSQIDVVHNAINLALVRSDLSPAAAKMRLNIEPETMVVGIAARLVPVKRLDLFLAAARHINAEFPDVAFLIAGAGREISSLRESIRGTDIQKKVLFLGQRDDIYDVMRAMDTLLITSDHEGLPTALLEAMALGVATVSRDVGGIGEVVLDGVNGLLVDSSDPQILARACVYLLSDEGCRHRLAFAGLKTAEQCSSQNNAAKIIRIYRSLTLQ
jgi:glycosyltransferase involved in cell wall biosynthesis